jgi:hypothetical protein
MEEELRETTAIAFLTHLRTILLFVAAWIESWLQTRPVTDSTLEELSNETIPVCRECSEAVPLPAVYFGRCILHPPPYYIDRCAVCDEPEPRLGVLTYHEYETVRTAPSCDGFGHTWKRPCEASYQDAVNKFKAALKNHTTWARFQRHATQKPHFAGCSHERAVKTCYVCKLPWDNKPVHCYVRDPAQHVHCPDCGLDTLA